MTTKSLKLTVAAAFMVLATALLGAGSVAALPVNPVDLVPLGNSAPQGAAAAEIAAYHPGTKRAFVTDAAHNQLDIFDLTSPSTPTLISSIDLAPYGATPNSVAVSKRCGGRVVVAIEASPKTSAGTLAMFTTSGTHLVSKTVGAQPDNVVVSQGGALHICQRR